jgi:hypothetical protein
MQTIQLGSGLPNDKKGVQKSSLIYETALI